MSIFSRWFKNIYLCQYSATGVFFYTAYQKGEELYSVSRLVGPPDTRIHTKEANYYTATVCDDAFYTEENKLAVTMTRTAENECVSSGWL